MAAYSIAHGRAQEHADDLRRGLAALPTEFYADVCGLCDGLGEYKQRFTAGCGGGTFLSIGGCPMCDGTGLMQGSNSAPMSVRNQVLVAAKK